MTTRLIVYYDIIILYGDVCKNYYAHVKKILNKWLLINNNNNIIITNSDQNIM